MIQELLRKFQRQKLNEIQGTLRQHHKLWRQVEKDRGQDFTPCQISEKHSFLLQGSCGTANWSALLIAHLPKLSQIKLLCLYTEGLGCPSAGPWQDEGIDWQHPHEFHQGKSKVLHIEEMSLAQQFRLETKKLWSTLWERKVGVCWTRSWTRFSSVPVQQWGLN